MVLSEKTISTPKIAFLFITNGDIHNPNIWKKYFDKNNNKYSIYLFSKNRNINSFFKNYMIDEFIDWTSLGTVKAMIKLLEISYKDGTNTYFVFLNEHSVPIVNFNKFYKKVINSHKSHLELQKNKSEFNNLKNPSHINLNNDNFYSSNIFGLLYRNHVTTIMNSQLKYSNIFSKIKNPERYYNINILNLNKQIGKIINNNINKKIENDNYKNEIQYLIKKNCYFIRKKFYNKNNNFTNFIISLI